MKHSKTALIIVAIVVLAGFIIWFIQKNQAMQEIPQEDVQSYITEHISDISPEKEVLGGKFYVTRIQANNGKGIVEYEDGHVAYKADFTYTFDRNGEVIVKSFIIRD